MNRLFTDHGWQDFSEWFNRDRKMYRRLIKIIDDIDRDPFDGLGKPEALKGNLSSYWSRRITEEHRLVYKIEGENIVIVQCMYHYDRRG